MVIRPENQGRGLSKLLVKGIISEFLSRGTEFLHILVAKSNIPAKSLYDSMGFEVRGETEMYGNNYYLMEKFIG